MKFKVFSALALCSTLLGCAVAKQVINAIDSEGPLICKTVQAMDPDNTEAIKICGVVAADVSLVTNIIEGTIEVFSKAKKLSIAEDPLVSVNIKGVTAMPIRRSAATKALQLSKGNK